MTDSFDTLLIANRGEIAVRIIRTARKLGLRTVAVYSEADRGSMHVRMADEAVLLGPAAAADSYLRGDLILDAARDTGAGAIHPGYGFLSENADFARACGEAGIVFVGPTPEQLELFGTKHTARASAAAAGVPLLAGTDLLAGLDAALDAAEEIGYPVMLKATAGGGGIGMQACHDAAELRSHWEGVQRTAGANFSSAGVFLERLVSKARHVEVQVFGDGDGRVITLGDRDCSIQRRNQKVCEEAPAPDLPAAVRDQIAVSARNLCAQVGYRSAGTVEFIYDAERQVASFLEVNTRLQVEHPVTEMIFGIDLVEWMLRLAQGETEMFDRVWSPSGHAVEARVYAENTDLANLPSAGTISLAAFSASARTDTWIETGSEVSSHYDPMLAKVITHAPDRSTAWANLRQALSETRIEGIATNLGLLVSVAVDPEVLAANHSTATLATVINTTPRIEVLRAGMLATIQDWPGRAGYWSVGIPPSGPMDDRSFRLGNRALGNPEGTSGLEITMAGPRLRFHTDHWFMITGAPTPVTLDGTPVEAWKPVLAPSGAALDIGTPEIGMRSYLLVDGGFDLAPVLGSNATFDLGQMGGAAGRALRVGDVLPLISITGDRQRSEVPMAARPQIGHDWHLAALEGPHAAPEFFTAADVEDFFAASWSVHFNSARTGVRLVGPKPQWARGDGGEAGLHPSNIHDTPYAVGSVDYTGDLPILLGPDGPSLGGFTCPATVASGDLWKLGQLRPGDTVRFTPVTDEQARLLRTDPGLAVTAGRPPVTDGGVLARIEATDHSPAVTYRRSGDRNLLIEYGAMTLDLASRMRIHALAEAVTAAAIAGLTDLTPGIRSLQIQFDPDLVEAPALLEKLITLDQALPATEELVVPSRTVHLPLSWDDPATREAIERYMHGVRDDAPWCPWNIEFIRRINGLDSVDDVLRTVFDAEYLVLGLGDVYLGAPVATPIDPRHRLVTTKYNPARTWTPQNAVGIGGAYLCIYGMEGPGGYQFVGRTVPIWSTHRQATPFEPGTPWLLRFFDKISWYPVSAEELLEMRAEMAAGRLPIKIEEGTFSMADYLRFLDQHADSIDEFKLSQATAFAAERDAWERAGEFDRAAVAESASATGSVPEVVIPAGAEGVEAPFTGNVFRIDVEIGDRVSEGQTLVSLEAMKMEAPVTAPSSGIVIEIIAKPGTQVAPGEVLVIVRREQAA